MKIVLIANCQSETLALCMTALFSGNIPGGEWLRRLQVVAANLARSKVLVCFSIALLVLPRLPAGSFFVSLRCEKQKTPTGRTEVKTMEYQSNNNYFGLANVACD